jgi:hypothetical protein
VKEADYMLDPSLSLEQKDMLSALLDPLADDDSGIDLIGEELPAPETSFTGLTEVSVLGGGGGGGVCVCGGGVWRGRGGDADMWWWWWRGGGARGGGVCVCVCTAGPPG